MSQVNAKAANSDQPQRRQRAVALLLAGVAGAAVMVVELGVARILTPVFGGSITVWALVIATTMLALAAGYAFGGHRADLTGGMRVARRAATPRKRKLAERQAEQRGTLRADAAIAVYQKNFSPEGETQRDDSVPVAEARLGNPAAAQRTAGTDSATLSR